MTIRSRSYHPIRLRVPGQKRVQFNNGVRSESVSNDPINYDLSGRQTTVSEGHQWPPRNGGLADIGGNFKTWKSYCSKGPPSGTVSKYTLFNAGAPRIEYTDSYTGPLMPIDPRSMTLIPAFFTSDDDLDELGATAISRCKPDNSVANLATALGELRNDGLPHIINSQSWQSKSKAARDAGSEYLNVQFGWKPLISDVSDFASGITRSRSILEQYERDAGKVVRRANYFPLISREQNESIPDSQLWGPLGGTELLGKGTLNIRTETRISRWFKGAFTYYLPVGYDSRSKVDKLALLADRLGLQASPETLWNIAPWSWAVDWFSNTGDVISNVSSFINHGLVMQYGYMMEHTIVKKTYTLGGITYPRGASGPRATSMAFTFESKVRRQANPYGFGVQWSGLSPFQTSILAALGISRRK
ncbi:maturation protein [ssRNA phage Zoerhiza.4_6]|uniref:Maturation protein n=2 Tax=Leviviricetes TaxID=2842243 RepID=A0A8S5L209_9VIRU|nr:maturation protein [ssRNA phage Zoerhiza.4_6]QDH91378.1 MAG: hypothetical protein H4Rhizo43385_000003 [Leviviridae sp.]DAD51484.1 TPA_asm: maturation protein [ssRNA phage Zoerhiza.4_6]